MERQSPNIILLLNDSDIQSELIFKRIYERFQKNQIICYNKVIDILNNLDNPSVVIFSAQLCDDDAFGKYDTLMIS